MLELYLANSKLTVSLPDYTIQLDAFFTTTDFFVSVLDIDYIGCISNFPNFRTLSLPDFQVATLSDSQQSNNLASLLNQYKSSQLLCSSQEDNFSTLLIIVSKNFQFSSLDFKDQDFVLLKFSRKDLLGDFLPAYKNYITNIKASISQAQKKNSELYSKISQASEDKKRKNELLMNLTGINNSLLGQLEEIKRRLLEHNRAFEQLRKEEAEFGPGLRCLLCENNLRNVLYLPCKHLALCTECLVNNFKTDTGGPVQRKNYFQCQICRLKVKETRAVKLF